MGKSIKGEPPLIVLFTVSGMTAATHKQVTRFFDKLSINKVKRQSSNLKVKSSGEQDV